MRPIAAYSHKLPSLVFYAGKPVTRLSSDEDVRAYFESHPTGSLVTTDAGWARLGEGIAATGVVVHEVPRFPQSGSVLVIQRSHFWSPSVVTQASATAEPAEVR